MNDIIYELSNNWKLNNIKYSIIEDENNNVSKNELMLKICVERCDKKIIINHTNEILSLNNYRVIFVKNNYNVDTVYAKNQKKIIRINFLASLSLWCLNVPYKISSYKNIFGFAYDPNTSFLFTHLIPFFKNDKSIIIKNSSKIVSTKDLSRINIQKANKLSPLFRDIFLEKKDDKIKVFKIKFLLYLILFNLKHPLFFLQNLISKLTKIFRFSFGKLTPIIALVGGDGVGKTTTIDSIVKNVPGIFNGYKAQFWRPGILPSLQVILKSESKNIIIDDNLVIPRLKPGKFQFFRQFYYLVDFVLGVYINDYALSRRAKLVIYDRSFLDIFVHPVRYGFKIIKLTKLFKLIVPKYDLVLWLHDDLKKVYDRKPELPIKTLKLHHELWKNEFVNENINYSIHVNRSIPQITYEIRDLVINKFFSMHYQNEFELKTQEKWLNSFFDIKPSNSYNTNNKLLILHFRDGRGYVFSKSNSTILSKSIDIYVPASTKAFLYKKCLQLLISLGIGNFILRRISINDAQLNTFMNHIKSLLSINEDIYYTISLGAPGPRRKLVICLMAIDGNIIAYIKIANTKNAIEGLKNESDALKILAKYSFNSIKVPRKIANGNWNEQYYLVTSALLNMKSSKYNFILKDLELLKIIKEFSLINFEKTIFQQSTFFLELQKSIASIKIPYIKHLCEDTFEICKLLVEDMELPFHFAHGDFTPWNMFNTKPKIGLFDFEYMIENAPAGFDIFRYHIQKTILVDKLPKKYVHDNFVNKNGWYLVVENHLKNFNLTSSNYSKIIDGFYGCYLIYHICIYEDDMELFGINMSTLSYLLNLFYLDRKYSLEKM